MNVFLSYMMLGISLSAPIGPINAAQLDKGLKNGFWHAWIVGFGALLADVLYMLCVYFGVVHFLETPFMQTFLWLFGCFVLLYIGLESVLKAGDAASYQARGDETLTRSLLSGFLMALTNPLNILFWLGIYGSVLAKTASTFGMKELILYSLGIIAGILLWDIIMASIASTFRKVLTPRMLRFISIASGVSLIGFGLYFGFQAAKLLFG
ncbi:LysE family transporter [Paenibacillus sp. YYML68]|uniref:LysE family transporter n=1 Tax=Paenibacillus sp. YYML68 TaxID=2909250 RepID=UPI002490043D|nr:LysE family transporter [Paenibacillus sp. YYML68]